MGRDLDALGVPILYLTAVTLLLIGAPAVGAAIVRRRPRWMQVLAGVGALLVLIFGYQAIDAMLKGAFAEIEPWWLPDELGIVVTGTLCLIGGTFLSRTLETSLGPARTTTPTPA
jgi:hypothetical protein